MKTPQGSANYAALLTLLIWLQSLQINRRSSRTRQRQRKSALLNC
jgi:hypothetical protein